MVLGSSDWTLSSFGRMKFIIFDFLLFFAFPKSSFIRFHVDVRVFPFETNLRNPCSTKQRHPGYYSRTKLRKIIIIIIISNAIFWWTVWASNQHTHGKHFKTWWTTPVSILRFVSHYSCKRIRWNKLSQFSRKMIISSLAQQNTRYRNISGAKHQNIGLYS